MYGYGKELARRGHGADPARLSHDIWVRSGRPRAPRPTTSGKSEPFNAALIAELKRRLANMARR